ncbi:MAG TPA: hypothetical protein DEP84_21015 [Chloroflexi bacterium]|nr:hypothetical protein [Chloroflexota bacterium]
MRPQVAGALEQLGWVQKLTALPNRVPAKASEVLGSPHEQATDFNEWQMDVRRWLHSRHDFSTDLASNIVSFFELAFEHTRCPQRAWFGVHSSAVSLVVGGIFLAAICRSGENRGVWLLVDQQPPAFEGVEYWPVKSTRNSKFPLIWAHSSLLTVIPNLIQNARIWESFSAASEKILYTPRVASDRDAVQERRKKRRLTDFWGNRAVNLFPDEVDEKAEFREGAKRQVTVNAYERDPRAREACIQHYGARCFICGFSFGEFYGKVADGFIHVHHLRPLSEIGAEYTIDPIEELRPVCPNCHAVLHLHPKSPFSIQEVVELLHQRSAS